ncbi:ATP-binding cassette domain-containing protein [Clostridium sporogenes]|uniref:ATP-binding cassette domain-containing protein n=1 Tax=Clostridium botulinum TaxID=1491 RepID=A0A6M0T168_CLOBO|nr:ATP-binding cassette domain-containing protein [Clostridium sporogenes]NFA60700.1 ATP-binding cassette domain-containing protein [Clostridium botulinum]NFI74150.1 ATP-binding cassette domain-containing protein [Clostridium sporogenes]NFL71864.1 ATP-binding cassette domain-containing protein [Clostridium sporogenes]NFM23956.1 ATP-binding cassette domain-containing protein [Clostridium sporogenes]NFP62024.1 ATP-binding cassette domain-containing protein [Clostridium sporogenes]
MEYILETKKLSKKFKDIEVVKDMNLKVPKGCIYGFLGPNGAGKSTTIRMLLGLIKMTEGHVSILGKSIKKDRVKILKEVGALVESPSYYGNLTAYDNLEIIRKVLNLDKKNIEEALEIVSLSDSKNKLVKNFSLGMKQRLGIAKAIIGNPQILILDEPTNGLDPLGIIEIREMIKNLPKKTGMTIIVSSHILSEIEQIATHVGIINKGALCFQGTIGELMGLGKEVTRIIAEPKEDACIKLKELGYSLDVENNEILINKVKNSARLNKELVSTGIDVYQLSQDKETLEEIFINIIKR